MHENHKISLELTDNSEKNPVYDLRFKLYGHDYYEKKRVGLGKIRQSFSTFKECATYIEKANREFMCRGFDFWSVYDSTEKKVVASRFGLDYNV